MGWKLLNNGTYISDLGNDSIALIGVETVENLPFRNMATFQKRKQESKECSSYF